MPPMTKRAEKTENKRTEKGSLSKSSLAFGCANDVRLFAASLWYSHWQRLLFRCFFFAGICTEHFVEEPAALRYNHCLDRNLG